MYMFIYVTSTYTQELIGLELVLKFGYRFFFFPSDW